MRLALTVELMAWGGSWGGGVGLSDADRDGGRGEEGLLAVGEDWEDCGGLEALFAAAAASLSMARFALSFCKVRSNEIWSQCVSQHKQ